MKNFKNQDVRKVQSKIWYRLYLGFRNLNIIKYIFKYSQMIHFGVLVEKLEV